MPIDASSPDADAFDVRLKSNVREVLKAVFRRSNFLEVAEAASDRQQCLRFRLHALEQ